MRYSVAVWSLSAILGLLLIGGNRAQAAFKLPAQCDDRACQVRVIKHFSTKIRAIKRLLASVDPGRISKRKGRRYAMRVLVLAKRMAIHAKRLCARNKKLCRDLFIPSGTNRKAYRSIEDRVAEAQDEILDLQRQLSRWRGGGNARSRRKPAREPARCNSALRKAIALSVRATGQGPADSQRGMFLRLCRRANSRRVAKCVGRLKRWPSAGMKPIVRCAMLR